jgi:hypothetical protein
MGAGLVLSLCYNGVTEIGELETKFMERDRYQLMIGLGEGAEGKRLRVLFDRAAKKAGKPVTVWAREVLLVFVDESKIITNPIVEVLLNNNSDQRMQIDLRAVSGIRNSDSGNSSVQGLIGGQWLEMGHSAPEELLERWRRVHRF